MEEFPTPIPRDLAASFSLWAGDFSRTVYLVLAISINFCPLDPKQIRFMNYFVFCDTIDHPLDRKLSGSEVAGPPKNIYETESMDHELLFIVKHI